MLKKITLKKVILTLLVILVLIQFFRIDKTSPATDVSRDFLLISKAADETIGIIKASCYDCHSNTSRYPWYSNIAPVSWWLKNHVNEGRKHLNFSEWGNYTSKKADHKLEECVEMIEEGEMPMGSYTLIHGEARLNEQQRLLLVNWFNTLRTHESDEEKEHD